MTVEEIIREIKMLSPDERKVVVDYLLDSPSDRGVQVMNEDLAGAIADRVFAEHAGLFRELARAEENGRHA